MRRFDMEVVVDQPTIQKTTGLENIHDDAFYKVAAH